MLKKKFVVIGCGSIGKRHLKNLIDLGTKDIIAVDTAEDRIEEVEKEFGIRAYTELKIALTNKVNVAVICTPTSLHVPIALTLAKEKCHLFIEKPLSHSLDGVEELINEIERHKLYTMVGCNFRFHLGLRKIKALLQKGTIGNVLTARAQYGQYLPDCHPWEDYRQVYSAQHYLGGGVILDRIHEIDYMRWLLGEVKEIFCLAGHLSQLEINTEDTAEMLLQFVNGIIASIHLDYVRRTYDCSLEIVGDQGIIQWNYQDHKVRWYTPAVSKWETYQWDNYSGNEMYVEEMQHFLRVLSGKEKSEQDVRNGKRILEIALAAKRSAENGEIITL